MISDCSPDDNSNISNNENVMVYNSHRRRSLSGNAVLNKKNVYGSKNCKWKSGPESHLSNYNNSNKYTSVDNVGKMHSVVASETAENNLLVRDNVDGSDQSLITVTNYIKNQNQRLSESSGGGSGGSGGSGGCADTQSTISNKSSNTASSPSSFYKRLCQSGSSTKSKFKHYLSEHIAKSHNFISGSHPEQQATKKPIDLNESIGSSQGDWESNGGQFGYQVTSNSLPRARPVSLSSDYFEGTSYNNYVNMASSVLDKIRNINLGYLTQQQQQKSNEEINTNSAEQIINGKISNSLNASGDSSSNNESVNFPNPEPNPLKMPKVESPSSIMFSSKSLLGKSKRQRLSHSISYDPDYIIRHGLRNSHHRSHMCPDFSPERDKWERQISGYLQTSTPTGAALTAINFGLQKVTETDKFVMITKSPVQGPNEFLREGINHMEANKSLYSTIMQHSTCYDLMPDSGKVVIIDSQLQIRKAVDALEDNVMRAAPVWHSDRQDYCCVLAVQDMVLLLLHMLQLQTGSNSVNVAASVSAAAAALDENSQQQSDFYPYPHNKRCDSTSSNSSGNSASSNSSNREQDVEQFTQVSVERCLQLFPQLRCRWQQQKDLAVAASNNLLGRVAPETKLVSAIRLLMKLAATRGGGGGGNGMLLVVDEIRSGNPLFILTELRLLAYLQLQVSVSIPQHHRQYLQRYVLTEKLLPSQHIVPLPAQIDFGNQCSDSCQISRHQYCVPSSAQLFDILRAMARSHICCAIVANPPNNATAAATADRDHPIIIEDIITIADILLLIRLNRHRNPNVSVADIVQARSLYPVTFRDPIVHVQLDGITLMHQIMDLCVHKMATILLVTLKISPHSSFSFSGGSAYSTVINKDSMKYSFSSGSLVAVLSPLDVLSIILNIDQTDSVNGCFVQQIMRSSPGSVSSMKHVKHRTLSEVSSPTRYFNDSFDEKAEEVFKIDVS